MVYRFLKRYYFALVFVTGTLEWVFWPQLGVFILFLAALSPMILYYIGAVLWMSLLGFYHLLVGLWES